MNAQLPQIRQALSDTLDCLLELTRQNVRPAEARTRFRNLQQQHCAIPMDLIWEEERFDGAVHYDALLHAPGEGTVSVSYAPDRALPWPMRGTRRWDESTMLRVNQESVSMEQAVACLDFLWEAAPLTQRLVHVCLIQEELKRHPLDFTDDELQQGMDAFRRTRKLYRAEDMKTWLQRNGTTLDKLEKIIGDEILVAKLREQVTAHRVEEYFDRHHVAFDRVMGLRVDFPDKQSAQDALTQVLAGLIEFPALAQTRFVAAAADQSTAVRSGYFTMREADAADAEMFAALLAAMPGAILGPLPENGRWNLVLALGTLPAVLDETVHGDIQRRLFAEWLELRRQQSDIEWLWGNVSQTAMGLFPAS